MSRPHTVRFNPSQREAIEDLVDKGKAENESQAHRMLVNAGMEAYGFTPRGATDTRLRVMAGELAKLFAYVGIAWIAFFWAFPVQFRLVGAAVVVAALGMVGVYVALGYVEPDLSRRLFSRGERA